jgi:hypothetical protein
LTIYCELLAHSEPSPHPRQCPAEHGGRCKLTGLVLMPGTAKAGMKGKRAAPPGPINGTIKIHSLSISLLSSLFFTMISTHVLCQEQDGFTISLVKCLHDPHTTWPRCPLTTTQTATPILLSFHPPSRACPSSVGPQSSMPKVEDVSAWAVDPASALRVLLAFPTHFLPLLRPYLPPSL